MALVHHRGRDVGRPGAGPGLIAWPEWWPRVFGFEDDGWLRLEEFQEGDTLVVRAELPDVDVDKDVQVTVDEGVVRIHGHREVRSEHNDQEGYRSEFRYGDFDRTIGLPPQASADDVKATYADGILEVRIPCPEKGRQKASKVPITKT